MCLTETENLLDIIKRSVLAKKGNKNKNKNLYFTCIILC